MVTRSDSKDLRPIGQIVELSLDRLTPNPGNRKIYDDERLESLAESIRTVGLLYPPLVRQKNGEEGQYLIVDGERRWRAMKKLRLASAPCLELYNNEDETGAEVKRVVANHHHLHLEPFEEAAAVRGLLDMGIEPDAVARSLGRPRAWVVRRASLTELSDRWLVEIRKPEGKFSTWLPSHLEVISRFPTDVQDRILDRWQSSWRWIVPTFQDLVEITGQFQHTLSSAPWELDDATIHPEAGACLACPKRSSYAPELFEGELEGGDGRKERGDRCLDLACWASKSDLFLKRRADSLRLEHPNLVLLSNEEDDPAELQEQFNGPVVSVTEVVSSRKSDANAFPALVVNGPGLGRVKWVQVLESEPDDPAESGRPKPETPAAERTLEDKREAYDKRRRQVLILTVKARLDALVAKGDLTELAETEGGRELTARGFAAKTLVLLTTLLTDQGWRRQVQDRGLSLPDILSWEALGSLRNHELGSGEIREALFQHCWRLQRFALHALSIRLSVPPGERDNLLHYQEAEAVCSMLGFDVATLRGEAAKAIPYAKIWREQVKDEWSLAVAADNGKESSELNGSESQ